jgi:hypothetical protein
VTGFNASRAASILRQPALLWVAFVAVHVWLIWLGIVVVPGALGDVYGVYKFWMDGLESGQFIVGVTTAWVYPLLAIVPMWVATVAGLANYTLTWLIMVTLVDALAFAILIHGAHKPSPRALSAWWWILALIALGPVALGRIDSVVTPLAVLGLLFLLTRPALAGVLLAAGAWMKVWPGAIILTAIIMLKRRAGVVAGVAALSLAVVAIGLVAGAGVNLLSFLQFQGTRGLQIESPGATWFLWAIALGNPDTRVYFDTDLLTYQVAGPGTDVVSSALTWLMAGAVVVTLLAMFWRSRQPGVAIHFVPAASLALVMALIAFNKVGSPQYFCWLIPPVLLGLIVDRARFIPVAVLSLLALVLTQVVYPWMYDEVLNTTPIGLFYLTLRNVLEMVLFVWALRLVLKRA